MADSDEDFSSSDEELLSNIASTSSSQTSKKKKPKQYHWKTKPFQTPDITFSGPTTDPPPSMDLSTPLEYFQRFVTDEMLDHVVEQSNQYSMQKYVQHIKEGIGAGNRHVLQNGSRAYVRSQSLLGEWDKSRSSKWCHELESISVISTSLDNMLVTDEDKKADKLWKICPWLSMLRGNCLKLTAEEHDSIDEMMVQYKGKTSNIRQYIRNKPHPWGFKIWVRAGSSGMVHDFDVYQGGDGADVVLKLAATLPHNFNYKIFADNLFTGIPLLLEIKQLGMHYTGTVRSNRLHDCHLPDEKYLNKKGRGLHDHKVEEEHGIVAVRWLDNKAVTLLLTYAGWDPKIKQHTEVDRPAVIREFNKFMGGIDLMDSYLAKYRRWYMYLFWHSLMIAIVNAWLLYRRDCESLQLPRKQ